MTRHLFSAITFEPLKWLPQGELQFLSTATGSGLANVTLYLSLTMSANSTALVATRILWHFMVGSCQRSESYGKGPRSSESCGNKLLTSDPEYTLNLFRREVEAQVTRNQCAASKSFLLKNSVSHTLISRRSSLGGNPQAKRGQPIYAHSHKRRRLAQIDPDCTSREISHIGTQLVLVLVITLVPRAIW